jgi:two-component system sporulation sensor kinase B
MKNAIESMQGGGTLSVKVDAGETDLCIQIEDTGVGMSEEQIKRIGMPFYTTKEKGTGLGLMVVISLLKTMNGKIEISSKNNLGTLISLKFKRTDPV